MAKKRKLWRYKPPDDGAEYSHRMSKNEKAARHRKSQAAYYERRGPALREAGRKAMAEKRAAIKARRRRWDRPTPLKNLEPLDDAEQEPDSQSLPGPPVDNVYVLRRDAAQRSSCSSLEPPDPRGWSPLLLTRGADGVQLEAAHAAVANSRHFADCDSAASPTSEERIAIQALEKLGQTTAADRPASVDLILEKAILVSSSRDSVGGLALRPRLAASGWVQRALQDVAGLNADGLTPPTSFDRTFWTRGDRALFRGEFLSKEAYLAVNVWRFRTDKSWRRMTLEERFEFEEDTTLAYHHL
ncbi:hypothetical protein B0H19DRAFT_1162470 [Mycena capillaripes]|nr:hypothetical protein B0H19DRAFT_1162470 [Mycena capillaripes]